MSGGNAREAALEEARQLYARHAWKSAFTALVRLDEDVALDVPELERLAWSASLIGDDAAFLRALERLYQRHIDGGAKSAAARWAFWLGFRLMIMGEHARGAAWLGRCQRIVEECGDECAEQGYLLLLPIQRALMSGDLDTAAETAARATDIGERFSEPDLTALARNFRGRALVRSGRVDDGMALCDESMLAATNGELSPIVTGLIYCSVISTCQRVFALDRAREWTAALARWCDEQPELVTFRGSCQVHRSEILQLAGEWEKALEQAARASTPELADGDPDAVGDAWYMVGEIHRLRGESELAEEAYVRSSQLGRDPQPGLAKLRAQQGEPGVAMTGLRRLLGETKDRLARARLLPVFVEVCLELEAMDEAADAADELERIAAEYNSEVIGAMSAHARGLVLLRKGDAQAALGPLRRAFYVWQRLGAPYEEARSRLALARACEALGDTEGARMAFEAARAQLEQLGATRDLAGLDRTEATSSRHGLTPRELQILRLLATGKTNRMIAEELERSEKTIDRHVSNIFNKIDVASRTAATAYAYENGLI